YCCEASSSCGVDIKDCSFTVEKDVTCDDPTDPVAVFHPDSVDALPGEEIGFRISICNTGDTNISTVGLDDDLGCEAWYVGSSVDAFITDGAGKDDVTTCVCETDDCPTFGSLKELIDLKDCPSAQYIPPGECLVISFRVKVPEINPYPDECCNTATVTAKTDICEAAEADPCGQEADTACINVLEPGIACDKEVTADYGNNSSIDDGPTSDLTIPDLAEYPIALVYELTVENTGDVALHGAKICDEELVSDALDPDVVAAGITIGACDLCEVPCDDGINDTCAELGDIPAGETRTATCKIIIPDRDAFDVWELTDGVEDDQYCNKAIGHGTVEVDDVTTCGPETPEEIMSGPCITCVRVPRPVTRCYPRVKARVTAWNQEETLFTGLHHCITQWDQTPLSLYGQELGAPNYMTREFLQTDKGVARIEGMASGYCDTDGYVSEDAPLIGVAHKQLRLEQNPPLTRLDATGMHLIGMSTEIGSLRYTLDAGGGEKRGASADSPADGLHDAPLMGPTESGTISGSASTTPHPLMAAPANLTDVRGGITQKGSLIVFPKVELRWRFIENQWTLIQDTFLDLTNDNEDEVDVLIYYVNGDEPMAATNGEREHRGCNFEPISKTLTGNQPAYWSAYTGMPGPDGTSMPSWTLLDPGPADQPGRPANDGSNDRVLRGYVLVWAVDDFGDGDREISWNHLKGDALLINYVDLTAWEYNTWAFQSVDPAVQLGEATGTPGTLLLDGEEYEIVPGQLLLDFYASGTVLPFNQQQGWSVKVVDTDLTLLPMLQDLRQR
ncbi:MAG: hypothetical protein GY842_20400, partial [bacterium]|nr:hypothetical protein [bacterium]